MSITINTEGNITHLYIHLVQFYLMSDLILSKQTQMFIKCFTICSYSLCSCDVLTLKVNEQTTEKSKLFSPHIQNNLKTSQKVSKKQFWVKAQTVSKQALHKALRVAQFTGLEIYTIVQTSHLNLSKV